ncbi:unnamed protein product [Spirodela intermedia]|uniref:RWP-RK domain-containing protein n=1 Tax=Spirodela intermedia TaxID=51605 RepID=A0A7I8KNV6_SPIIN|nr:unnamed protein product [Spirodela intermedia]
MEDIDDVFRFLDSPEGKELCEVLSSLLSSDEELPPPPESTLQGDNVAGSGNVVSRVPITVAWMPFSGADCSRCHILRDVVHAGSHPRKKQRSTVPRNISRANIYANVVSNQHQGRGEGLKSRRLGSLVRERIKQLTYTDISQYFHLPATEAAQKLRICSTALKKVSRKFNLNRWPHRKFIFGPKVFRMYGRIRNVHALSFLSDLRLGHYAKGYPFPVHVHGPGANQKALSGLRLSFLFKPPLSAVQLAAPAAWWWPSGCWDRR